MVSLTTVLGVRDRLELFTVNFHWLLVIFICVRNIRMQNGRCAHPTLEFRHLIEEQCKNRT